MMFSGDALVLGIDPASVRVAYVAKSLILNTSAHRKYLLGKKFSPECCVEAKRTVETFLQLVSTMAVSDAPRVAFIEAPAMGRTRNVQTTIKQSFVSGVLQACLLEAGFKVYLVPPSTWKAEVCGNGSASKADVIRTVARRWPKMARRIGQDEDLNDAAALTIYGEAVFRKGQHLAQAGSLFENPA